ncbi:unnamed protein product [Callosobruchus maculatus]|uniref:Uncharacterized protein n=1 Tax=Callosobruchus maculatus TaxID=64391 RepID=A0A653BGA8_CALMS|nr:unnamed protein product [Callosobruchus maculatus]
MVYLGVIFPCSTEYVSPLVVLKKKFEYVEIPDF